MRRVALAALAAAACSPRAPAETRATVTSTQVVRASATIAVAAHDDTVYVFTPERAEVVARGTTVARAPAPSGGTFVDAAAIPGPDGERWVVAIAAGRAWRVAPTGELEELGARLGLGDARVLAIASDDRGFAIGLADGLAVSRDGRHVSRFTGDPATRVAIAGDLVAAIDGERVALRDLAAGTQVVFHVPGLQRLGFLAGAEPHPRLVATTARDVYLLERGTLRRQATPRHLSDLAIARDRVWLLADGRLHVLDHHTLAAADPDITGARIFAAPDGDVWLARGAELTRYDTSTRVDQQDWQARVAPVFERACAKCHRPGGEADFDLSTPAAWGAARATVRRVLDSRDMPPAGSPPLDAADRAALEAWLSGAAAAAS